ncbi:MAG: V-type ATPase subunit [Truepera sp.]|nr:V-type ATPase subunit [Truepera sp.]
MSADFGYINARIRGMKTRLLEPSFFQEALAGEGFRGFVQSLALSSYGSELETAQAAYADAPLRAVDEAVGRNFYHTTRSLLTFSSGPAREQIALLLMRYDVQNLKAIARAKHAGRSLDDIRQALFPAGELKPALLENIAAAADLPTAAQALAATRHPLAPAFSEAVRRYVSGGNLYGLELALDQALFETIFARLAEVPHSSGFRRYLELEVDATNLRTALKLRGAGGEGELFVKGGRQIGRATFEALLNDPAPSALQALAATRFKAVAEATDLSAQDEAIRQTLDRYAYRLMLREVLGIGVALDYLRRKESEVARLRLLARGKYYNVPREQLQKELGYA